MLLINLINALKEKITVAPALSERRQPYSRLAVLISATVSLACLAGGCASKEEQEKHRTKLLEGFVRQVTENLLDRNPETIRGHMTTLTHEELDEKLEEKLQNEKIMPETEIDVLKIIDESKPKQLSNKVVIDSVEPQGDIMKDVVAFKVTGKNIKLEGGKETESKNFVFTMTVRATPEMGDYPRAIDFVSEASTKSEPTSAAHHEEASHKARGRSKRHRH